MFMSESKSHHVYVITERATGALYLGKTSQVPDKRWRQHQWISKHPEYSYLWDTVHERMSKGGEFSFRVIRSFDSEDAALSFEGSLMQKFREHPDANVKARLLNTGSGKGRKLGYVQSEETKRKRRETKEKNFRRRLLEAYKRLGEAPTADGTSPIDG
jgi:predicted GIY-YIG superfamily endonuclease